jgi:hypothetical protein
VTTKVFIPPPCKGKTYGGLVDVSIGYPPVTGMSLTRYAPFRRSPPECCHSALPLDLHVLSLPLAFILSQDQTLLCIYTINFQFDPDRFFKKKSTLSFFSRSRYFVVLPSVFSMIFFVVQFVSVPNGIAKVGIIFKPANFFRKIFNFFCSS